MGTDEPFDRFTLPLAALAALLLLAPLLEGLAGEVETATSQELKAR